MGAVDSMVCLLSRNLGSTPNPEGEFPKENSPEFRLDKSARPVGSPDNLFSSIDFLETHTYGHKPLLQHALRKLTRPAA